MKVPIVVTLHDYGLICPKKTLLLTNRNVCETPFTLECVKCASEEYGFTKSLAVSVLTKHNRKYLGRVSRYFAVSSFVREVHCKYLGLPADDIVVIPNFYDADQELDAAGLGETLPDDFILFVGYLHPSKGVDVLQEAYSRIRTEVPLVLIGAKNPRYIYRETPDVRVFENAPAALVSEAYKRCRFVVIPSLFPDPSPTVAFEAMSREKAVIASNIGGLTDIVRDGETGFLVHRNDSVELMNRISYLLNSREKCARMGRMGKDRVTSLFSSQAIVPKIEKQYEVIATLH
jgi:glycosyltransferase involved in cell wall biosynthesis